MMNLEHRDLPNAEDRALAVRLADLRRATEQAGPSPGFAAHLLARIEKRFFVRQAVIAFSASALVAALGVAFFRRAHAELADALITAFDPTDGADP